MCGGPGYSGGFLNRKDGLLGCIALGRERSLKFHGRNLTLKKWKNDDHFYSENGYFMNGVSEILVLIRIFLKILIRLVKLIKTLSKLLRQSVWKVDARWR